MKWLKKFSRKPDETDDHSSSQSRADSNSSAHTNTSTGSATPPSASIFLGQFAQEDITPLSLDRALMAPSMSMQITADQVQQEETSLVHESGLPSRVVPEIFLECRFSRPLSEVSSSSTPNQFLRAHSEPMERVHSLSPQSTTRPASPTNNISEPTTTISTSPTTSNQELGEVRAIQENKGIASLTAPKTVDEFIGDVIETIQQNDPREYPIYMLSELRDKAGLTQELRRLKPFIQNCPHLVWLESPQRVGLAPPDAVLGEREVVFRRSNFVILKFNMFCALTVLGECLPPLGARVLVKKVVISDDRRNPWRVLEATVCSTTSLAAAGGLSAAAGGLSAAAAPKLAPKPTPPRTRGGRAARQNRVLREKNDDVVAVKPARTSSSSPTPLDNQDKSDQSGASTDAHEAIQDDTAPPTTSTTTPDTASTTPKAATSPATSTTGSPGPSRDTSPPLPRDTLGSPAVKSQAKKPNSCPVEEALVAYLRNKPNRYVALTEHQLDEFYQECPTAKDVVAAGDGVEKFINRCGQLFVVTASPSFLIALFESVAQLSFLQYCNRDSLPATRNALNSFQNQWKKMFNQHYKTPKPNKANTATSIHKLSKCGFLTQIDHQLSWEQGKVKMALETDLARAILAFEKTKPPVVSPPRQTIEPAGALWAELVLACPFPSGGFLPPTELPHPQTLFQSPSLPPDVDNSSSTLPLRSTGPLLPTPTHQHSDSSSWSFPAVSPLSVSSSSPLLMSPATAIGARGGRRGTPVRTGCGFVQRVPPPEFAGNVTGFFWDIENCSVPNGRKVWEVAQRIREVTGPVTEAFFACYCDVSTLKLTFRQELERSNVFLRDIVERKPNAADRMILEDIQRFTLIHKNATIVLVSGDGDFTNRLLSLKVSGGYRVILYHNVQASPQLVAAATHARRFEDVCANEIVE